MVLVNNKIVAEFNDLLGQLSNEQPTTFLGKVWQRLTHWSLREVDQKIDKTFYDLIAKAEEIIPSLSTNGFTQNERTQFDAGMHKLFYEIYPHMDYIKPFFKTNKMPKGVEGYLSPELKRLRAEKDANINAEKTDEMHKTSRKIAKGELAIKLGRGIKKNKGASGTVIIKDINQKSVGVFKVSKDHLSIYDRIVNFCRSFWGQLSCLSNQALAQPLSEYAAYLISKKLGFNLAPPSAQARINEMEGVFQVFVKHEKVGDLRIKYQEVMEVIEKIKSKTIFTLEELTLFQKFAIFDYLIGNLDRHEENWFVTLEDDKITHIKAIDNANSLPKKQPEKGTRAATNQYAWKELPIAKVAFTEDTVKFVKDNLKPQQIENLIVELIQELDGFLDLDMQALLRLRADVIYNLVQTDRTPDNLAFQSTKEEMEIALNFNDSMHRDFDEYQDVPITDI